MPIYEYECQACQHQLEALQKLSDAPLTKCPECGRDTLRKRISAAGFRLKGGGWYETDFKTGDRKKNLAGEKSDKSEKGKDAGSAGSGDSPSKPTAPASADG